MKLVESHFHNTSILVVGGAGFVGSNLVRSLLSLSSTVHLHIIDNLLSSEKFLVPNDSRIRFIEGSISNDLIVHSLNDEYDYIFHLATYHGNQSSIHDPLADHENNTLTSLKLFHQCRDFKRLKKIVYSGAGCAVAEKTFDETTATKEIDVVSLNMDSPYSISKIIGEFYAKYYHKQHNLPVVRVRFQNVYGPWEILGAGKWRGTAATVWRNVIPTFIYRALKQLPLHIENQGIATRDFIYVEDIVKGLLHAAVWGSPGDVYNLASGKELSIKELALAVNSLTKNPKEIIFLPKRSWDTSGKRYGCPEKTKRALGFEVNTSFEEGLKKTIVWTKEYLELIEQTIFKHHTHFSEESIT